MVSLKESMRVRSRSGILGIVLLYTLMCVGVRNAEAATIHYIAANGSDSSNGTSKTTPWLHIPSMPGCTANCASYSPAAGDQFILRGGDTWGAANVGLNWNWSGNSTQRIYIGVDKTWFSGASWTRPILDCQLTACANAGGYAILWFGGSYVTIDNFEFTGFQQSSSTTMVGTYGNYDEVSNFYIHHFTRTSASSNTISAGLSNNWSGGGGIGTKFHDNIIDGGDSPNPNKGDFLTAILHGDQVYNNVIRYVYNGMNGTFTSIHGNLVEHGLITSPSGDHCNMIYPQDVFQGSALYVYNNIVRYADGGCGGSLVFTLGNSSCTTCKAYVYNNILYDNSYGFDPGITIGSHTATGTYYIYNNTVEPIGASGECMRSGDPNASSTTHYANNHCISTGPICNGPGTNCINDGGNLLHTLATANAAGYTDAQTYAFSPTASNSPTVGAGINATSVCSLNAETAAMCSDTTYPTYDPTNHTVVMRTVHPRASSGAWDAGAYEYAGGGNTPPSPPTGLAAVVN